MTDYHGRVSRYGPAHTARRDPHAGCHPAGWMLPFEEVPVLIHAFRRMVRELAYDVTEMAFTTYLVARAHGKPFTALPVFLVRGFHHGAVLRGAASPAISPRELEGARRGV